VSFAAITLCVASQQVFIFVVYFVMTQSGNFWIRPPTYKIFIGKCDRKKPLGRPRRKWEHNIRIAVREIE
jgi:hypothetical protein